MKIIITRLKHAVRGRHFARGAARHLLTHAVRTRSTHAVTHMTLRAARCLVGEDTLTRRRAVCTTSGKHTVFHHLVYAAWLLLRGHLRCTRSDIGSRLTRFVRCAFSNAYALRFGLRLQHGSATFALLVFLTPAAHTDWLPCVCSHHLIRFQYSPGTAALPRAALPPLHSFPCGLRQAKNRGTLPRGLKAGMRKHFTFSRRSLFCISAPAPRGTLASALAARAAVRRCAHRCGTAFCVRCCAGHRLTACLTMNIIPYLHSTHCLSPPRCLAHA